MDLAVKVSSGAEPLPERASADAHYDADQAARAAILSLNSAAEAPEPPRC